jgi:hypothetical protein
MFTAFGLVVMNLCGTSHLLPCMSESALLSVFTWEPHHNALTHLGLILLWTWLLWRCLCRIRHFYYDYLISDFVRGTKWNYRRNSFGVCWLSKIWILPANPRIEWLLLLNIVPLLVIETLIWNKSQRSSLIRVLLRLHKCLIYSLLECFRQKWEIRHKFSNISCKNTLYQIRSTTSSTSSCLVQGRSFSRLSISIEILKQQFFASG